MKTVHHNKVAFIPVRGGSKSIPLKNIRNIAGKPLVHWTIEAALDCDAIDHVYVATDSNEIAACVNALGREKVSVIGRSPATCTDEASSESALLEFCSAYDFEQVVFIQATSPLLTANDLTQAWKKYGEGCCDSLLSLVRQKHFIWRELEQGGACPTNYEPVCRPRRQDFSGYLMENGAFYISQRARILESGCRISGKIDFHEMPEETYIDLDEPIDWLITEQILIDREKAKKIGLLKDIRMLVTDVDGVLTDSGMYYTENGDEIKKFCTRDGKGLDLIREAGFKIGIITSENVQLVQRRAKKLKVDHLMMGAQDKDFALRQMAAQAGVKLSEILYVGDDVNDLPAINIAGVSACPMDAVESVRKKAVLVLNSRGGHGVVREVCDLLLSEKRH